MNQRASDESWERLRLSGSELMRFEFLILVLLFVRWPTLMPILEPKYVVKKIINAVLTDQVYLLLPKSMYAITALKK